MTHLFNFLMIFFATLIGSFGAIFLKKGSKKIFPININLIFGIFLYALSAVFYLIALKQEKLSTMYPIISMGYVWIILFSMWFLGEKMNKWKLTGISGIILGVIIIGFGS